MATGAPVYIALATKAAESLRRHNPDLPIDLVTDHPHEVPVFDRVHVREDVWKHTKIDALIDSRFERTLYLDSDIQVLAPIDDIFEALDRFEVAVAHDQHRNGYWNQFYYRKPLPRTFPQFNGGVIAFRRNPAVQAFLKAWREAVIDHDIGRDQPSLRELLWESDLRIITLPPEYNFMNFKGISSWDRSQAAPRILHSPRFKQPYERYLKAEDPVTELIGLRRGRKLRELLATDRALAEKAGTPLPPLDRKNPNPGPGLAGLVERYVWIGRRLPRRLSGIAIRKTRRRLGLK